MLSDNIIEGHTSVVSGTLGYSNTVLGCEERVCLGWAHECADTARPVTADFAGAPSTNFIVVGATPQRDAAVISLAANSAIVQGASLYHRYDGEIGTGTDSHALSAGIRMTW